MSEAKATVTNVPQAAVPGKAMFYGPSFTEWKQLTAEAKEGATDAEVEKEANRAKGAQDELKQTLLTSLQMQHVVVLAGSGTSLGPTKGPSMRNLWDMCVKAVPPAGDGTPAPYDPSQVIKKVEYTAPSGEENIEELLSRCEAYVQVHPAEKDVLAFLTASKGIILKACSEFIDPYDATQLDPHRTFLHRLSRRRPRDSRLKVFTTNYDLCFEVAASQQGLVVVDGFSFSEPRHFDPRFFQYDIVKRPATGDEVGTPLEGVFHLHKLHGSVNWERVRDLDVKISVPPPAEFACIIYPAKGKYQQSYVQPHLELMSRYLAALREPNTCLIVVGFGFNDDHLSEPILSAVKSNPHLRLIVVNRSAHDCIDAAQPGRYWKELKALAEKDGDVWFINSDFGDFAERIPDLKSLTPAERLSRDLRDIIA